jgi:hypothetical protein
MIKNWNLFLESFDNDDEFNFDEIKNQIIKVFAPLFITEALMRPISNKEQIEELAQMLLTSLLKGFGDAINSKDSIPDEEKIEMATNFSKFAQEGKEVMVEKSFKEGIILVFENFVNYLKDRKMELEGEGWKKNLIKDDEPVDELENLSKSEIGKLIDDALDRGDFKEVEKLSKYLESNQYVDNPELKKMIDDVVDILLKLVDDVYA